MWCPTHRNGKGSYCFSDSDVQQCIIWCTDGGARIISASFGGPGQPAFGPSIKKSNFLWVGSAGNDKKPFPYYPSGLGYANVLSVGATT